jgi:hypothetical protein
MVVIGERAGPPFKPCVPISGTRLTDGRRDDACTAAEGDITHLHVGLKGTMNALFLKDLADKTRRGLRGRVELGKSGGGLCYGYRVRRATHDGVATGEREIVPAEAEVIRRIFRDYAAGLSPKALAKRLNAERCPGPGGTPWNPSTIHGNPARGSGILNNELYVGRLVWNRLRYVKNPDTGKRVSRANPPSEAIQPGTAPEVSLLRSDEVRRVRRRVRHVLARPPGLLRGSLARYVHQSPDHQPPGGGRTRARGATRQIDAPGFVRGLLPRVRARVESPADGAPRGPDARPCGTRQCRARDSEAY